MKNEISLIVVDDHAMFRRSLSRILEFEGFKVLGDFENGQQAIDAIPGMNPDIVLMDFEMPVMDGVAASKWIKQNHPETKVIALSMKSDDLSVIRMLRAGVRAFIFKGSEPEELVNAIMDVHQNGIHYSQLLTQGLSNLYNHASANSDEQAVTTLTEREIEFLKLCVTEQTYKQMAEELGVSVRTIDGYRESVCEKFNLKSRAGLALLAVKLKIVRF
jgi:DNA-binding NarL/FixJ family response regulator